GPLLWRRDLPRGRRVRGICAAHRLARPIGRKPGASHAPVAACTFPKLLIRNAREFGNRPAMRHKDLGIWQTLTWAQLLDEVRAYAAGLHRLCVCPGDTSGVC